MFQLLFLGLRSTSSSTLTNLFTVNIALAQENKSSDKVIVKAKEIRSWLEYLASDELEGRMSGSDGLLKAENWLIKKFEEIDRAIAALFNLSEEEKNKLKKIARKYIQDNYSEDVWKKEYIKVYLDR